MIVKPDLWGHNMRVRLSNLFGSKPVTFASVTVALQEHAANLVAGTNTQDLLQRPDQRHGARGCGGVQRPDPAWVGQRRG